MTKFPSLCTSSSITSLRVCGKPVWRNPQLHFRASSCLRFSTCPCKCQMFRYLQQALLSFSFLHSAQPFTCLLASNRACSVTFVSSPRGACCLFSLKIREGFPLPSPVLVSASCCCCILVSGPSSDFTYLLCHLEQCLLGGPSCCLC